MTQTFEPGTPDFEQRVRDSFSKQKMMAHMGASLALIEAGQVEIVLPFDDKLTQQHGFFHAGATSTIADSAGGYAAFTLFPAEVSVLTAEFKLNLLAPASGERLRARGRVIKPGRTPTTCDLEVYAVQADGTSKLCAKGLQTMVRVGERADIGQAG